MSALPDVTATRRSVLAIGVAAATAPDAVLADAAATRPSLDRDAQLRGLHFGSAVAANARGGVDNPAYAAVITAECGLVAPENEMKWRALQPTPDDYRFGPADRIVAWAQAHGLAMRGHNLLWHNAKWLPAWVDAYDFGSRPATAAEALLVNHVTKVCRHFGERFTSWDVVNETIDPSTGALRETVFTRALGDRVIDITFHAAREALPRTKLVYNDYMSWGADDGRHRAGVLRLLERLKRDGVPVDALGLQSHLDSKSGLAGQNAPQPQAWRAFLGEVTDLSLGLLVTELDVAGQGLQGVAAQDAADAAVVRDYLDLTLSFPQVSDVLCWGMVDRFSWLQHDAHRPGQPLARPLPYDDDYRPKPMREAIATALHAAPTRSTM